MAGYVLPVEVRISGVSGLSAIDQINQSLRNATQAANLNVNIPRGAASQISQITQNARQLQQVMNTAGSSASRMTSGLNAIGASAGAARAGVVELTTAFSSFTNQIGLALRRFVAFTAGVGTLFRAFAGIREGISQAVEFERSLNRVQQVSGDSAITTAKLKSEITNLATAYGVSSSELVKSAVTLRQAGLAADDVRKSLSTLAKTSLAPNFDDMTKTVEGFIAISQQFKIAAGDNMEKALSSVNAVASAFAVEGRDIIEAVRRAGGAFSSVSGDITDANTKLSQFIGIFTSIRATTRESADSIATGLRTIFSRLQRSDTVDALKQFGVQLRYTKQEAQAAGDLGLRDQFVGAYEAINRLGTALSGLRSTDPRYGAIIEELGGIRQVSRVLPLLQQTTEAQKAFTVAQAGQTSLTISAERAQDTLINRLDKTKESYLDLFRTLTDSSGFQSVARSILYLSDTFKTLFESVKPFIGPTIALGIAGIIRGFTAATINGGAGVGAAFNAGVIGQHAVRRAVGGEVPGTGFGDKTHLLAEPGEFVLRREVARQIGYSRLNEWNKGRSGNIQKYAGGGDVRYAEVATPPPGYVGLFSDGGNPAQKYLHPLFYGDFNAETNYIKDLSKTVGKASGIHYKGLIDSVRKINQGEMTSLRVYTSLPTVNRFLRNPSSLNEYRYPEFKKYLSLITGQTGEFDYKQLINVESDPRVLANLAKIIQSAISTGIIVGKQPLYRGIGTRTLQKILGDSVSSYSVIGKEFTDKGFFSTSLSLDVAKRFNKGVEPRILQVIPKLGASAAYLERISKTKGEEEILLQRNSRFRIVGQEGKQTIVEQLNRGGSLRFASGGIVPGSGNTDSVPAVLPPGAFVIRKSSVESIGASRLASLSSPTSRTPLGGPRGFSEGGVNALLTPGEFVYGPDDAARIGTSRLRMMNQTGRVGFNAGGLVGLPRFAEGDQKYNRFVFNADDPRDDIYDIKKIAAAGTKPNIDAQALANFQKNLASLLVALGLASAETGKLTKSIEGYGVIVGQTRYRGKTRYDIKGIVDKEDNATLLANPVNAEGVFDGNVTVNPKLKNAINRRARRIPSSTTPLDLLDPQHRDFNPIAGLKNLTQSTEKASSLPPKEYASRIALYSKFAESSGQTGSNFENDAGAKPLPYKLGYTDEEAGISRPKVSSVDDFFDKRLKNIRSQRLVGEINPSRDVVPTIYSENDKRLVPVTQAAVLTPVPQRFYGAQNLDPNSVITQKSASSTAIVPISPSFYPAFDNRTSLGATPTQYALPYQQIPSKAASESTATARPAIIIPPSYGVGFRPEKVERTPYVSPITVASIAGGGSPNLGNFVIPGVPAAGGGGARVPPAAPPGAPGAPLPPPDEDPKNIARQKSIKTDLSEAQLERSALDAYAGNTISPGPATVRTPVDIPIKPNEYGQLPPVHPSESPNRNLPLDHPSRTNIAPKPRDIKKYEKDRAKKSTQLSQEIEARHIEQQKEQARLAADTKKYEGQAEIDAQLEKLGDPSTFRPNTNLTKAEQDRQLAAIRRAQSKAPEIERQETLRKETRKLVRESNKRVSVVRDGPSFTQGLGNEDIAVIQEKRRLARGENALYANTADSADIRDFDSAGRPQGVLNADVRQQQNFLKKIQGSGINFTDPLALKQYFKDQLPNLTADQGQQLYETISKIAGPSGSVLGNADKAILQNTLKNRGQTLTPQEAAANFRHGQNIDSVEQELEAARQSKAAAPVYDDAKRQRAVGRRFLERNPELVKFLDGKGDLLDDRRPQSVSLQEILSDKTTQSVNKELLKRTGLTPKAGDGRDYQTKLGQARGAVSDAEQNRLFQETYRTQEKAVANELLNAERRALKAVYSQASSADLTARAQENVHKALQGQVDIIRDTNGKLIGTKATVDAAKNAGVALNANQPQQSLFGRIGSAIGNNGFVRGAANFLGFGGILPPQYNGPPGGGTGGPGGTSGFLPGGYNQSRFFALQSASFFLAPLLSQQFEKFGGGTAENAAVTGADTSFRTGRGLSGGTQLALSSSLIASSIPALAPFTLPIAAGAFALGGIQGAQAGGSELRNTKIANSVTALTDRLQSINNLGPLAGNDLIASALEERRKITEESRAENIYQSSSFLGIGFNEDKYFNLARKSNRQNLGQLTPQFTKILLDQAQSLGNENTDVDASKLVGRLSSRGFNAGLIRDLADIRSTTQDTIVNELKQTIIQAQRDTANRRGQLGGNRVESQATNDFGQLVTSIQQASLALRGLSIQADQLSTAFSGAITTGSVSLGSEVLGAQGRLGDSLLSPLRTLSAYGGQQGSNILSSGTALLEVEKVLPAAIAAVANRPALGEKETPTTSLITSINTLLKQRGVDTESTDVQRVLLSIQKQFSQIDTGVPFQKFIESLQGFDVGDLTAKLLSGVEGPLRKFSGESLKLLTDRANTLASGFDRLAQNVEKAGEFRDRAAVLGVNISRLQAEKQAASLGRRIDAPDFLSLADLQKPITQQLQRLSGRANATPEQIGADFASTQNVLQQILPIRERFARREFNQADKDVVNNLIPGIDFKNPNTAFEKVSKFASDLSARSSNLLKSLELLANVSAREAGIIEKRQRIENDAASRRGLAERFYNSDSGGVAELNRGLLLSRIAAQNGSLDSFSQPDRSLIISTLKSVGQARLTGFEGTPTGEGLLQKLLTSGIGKVFGLDPERAGEQKSLEQQQIEIAQQGQKALETYANAIESSNTSLISNLKSQSDTFFARLEQLFRDSKVVGLQANANQLQTGDLGKYERASGAIDRFAKFGIKDQEQVDFLTKNRDDVLAALAYRERALKNNQNAQSLQANLPDILKQTKIDGENLSDFLAKGQGPTGRLKAVEAVLANKAFSGIGNQEEIKKYLYGQFTPSTEATLQGKAAVNDQLKSRFSAIPQGIAGIVDNTKPTDIETRAIGDISRAGINFGGLADLAGPTGKVLKDYLDVIQNAGGNIANIRKEKDRLRKELGKLQREILLLEDNPQGISREDAGGFATGGIAGRDYFRPQGSDVIPAMLSHNEYVINSRSATANKPLLDAINQAKGPLYLADGLFLDSKNFNNTNIGKQQALFTALNRIKDSSTRKIFLESLGYDKTIDVDLEFAAGRLSPKNLSDVSIDDIVTDANRALKKQSDFEQEKAIAERDRFETSRNLREQARQAFANRPKQPAGNLGVENTSFSGLFASDSFQSSISKAQRAVQIRSEVNEALQEEANRNLGGASNFIANVRHFAPDPLLGNRGNRLGEVAGNVALGQQQSNLLYRQLLTQAGGFAPDDKVATNIILSGASKRDELNKDLLKKDLDFRNFEAFVLKKRTNYVPFAPRPLFPLPRFATGGVIPGYSSTDDKLIMAMGGEAILNRSATNALGAATIARLNSNPQAISRFASGGTIGQSQQTGIVSNVGDGSGQAARGFGGPLMPPEVVQAMQETTQAFTRWSETSNILVTSLEAWNGAARELADVLRTFPSQITGNFTHSVNVDIRGDALGQLQDELKKSISQLITRQVISVLQRYLPDAPIGD